MEETTALIVLPDDMAEIGLASSTALPPVADMAALPVLQSSGNEPARLSVLTPSQNHEQEQQTPSQQLDYSDLTAHYRKDVKAKPKLSFAANVMETLEPPEVLTKSSSATLTSLLSSSGTNQTTSSATNILPPTNFPSGTTGVTKEHHSHHHNHHYHLSHGAVSAKRLYRAACYSENTPAATVAVAADDNNNTATHSTTLAFTSVRADPSGMGGSSNHAKNSNMAVSEVTTSTSTTAMNTSISSKFVTRDIAALDFLLGIPLAAEATIVREGWALNCQLQQDQNDPSDDEDINAAINKNHTTGQNNRSARGGAVRNTLPEPPQGTWWSKYLVGSNTATGDGPSKNINNKNLTSEEAELERPDATLTKVQQSITSGVAVIPGYTPGRRLDGDAAIQVRIPSFDSVQRTKQKSIARTAAVREWERQTAHGLGNVNHPPLLDGRLFFSAAGSYPISVFSLIRYEPKREQAEILRKRLESLGGGGSQFVMPTRDWRGISYRVLLPRSETKSSLAFNRFVRDDVTSEDGGTDFRNVISSIGNSNNNRNGEGMRLEEEKHEEGYSSPAGWVDNDDEVLAYTHESNQNPINLNENDDDEDDTDDDSDVYVPGILDDPNMVLGRHRNVMVGDHITGPIISSTIQFVKPALLKAELNKQFRERFDGWEPPKAARKYIGAYVSLQEGRYVLHDPTEDTMPLSGTIYDKSEEQRDARKRKGSSASLGSANEGVPKEKALRMPPSLTLSKVRSLKQQALSAALKAKLEVGTVALACVYFERLCMDCRVDKTNRRLCMAACLLIASKLNEPNVGLVILPTKEHSTDKTSRLHSLVRPSKRSNKIFASLLEFFTEQWNLTVKTLFDAEWGVFVALGFQLHATPSQVAFHFRRLMKTLEWKPRTYLGKEMWEQWQDALMEEERRKRQRERRRERKRKRKEERLLGLKIKLENEVYRRQQKSTEGMLELPERQISGNVKPEAPREQERRSPSQEQRGRKATSSHASGLKLFNRLGLRRSQSAERISSSHSPSAPAPPTVAYIPASPSMPVFPTTQTSPLTIEIPLAAPAEDESLTMNADDTDHMLMV